MKSRRWTSILMALGLGFLPAAGARADDSPATWIGGIGIDTGNPAQNHADFYDEAEGFLNSCKRFNMQNKRDCQLYMNVDKQFAPDGSHPVDPNDVTGSPLSPGLTAPNPVLEAFRKSLLNAKPGGRIVLSLQDHGAPGATTASCIYMNGTEKICLDDVKKILALKPPGVKVLIVGGACFSGGFSELSSRDVCTFTAADNTRMGTDIGFWSNVYDTKAKNGKVTLADVRDTHTWDAVRGHGGGFGSQVIRAGMCRARASCENCAGWIRLRDDFSKFVQSSKQEDEDRDTILGCSRVDSGKVRIQGVDALFSVFNTHDGDLVAMENLKKRYCGKVSDVNERICKAVDLYEAKLKDVDQAYAEVRSVLDLYRDRERKLKELDQKLSADGAKAGPGGSADLEAKRGELLSSLETFQKMAKQKIKLVWKNPAYLAIHQAVDAIAEESCSNIPPLLKITDAETSFNAGPLSSYRKVNIPLTDKALNESLECESSFTFP